MDEDMLKSWLLSEISLGRIQSEIVTKQKASSPLCGKLTLSQTTHPSQMVFFLQIPGLYFCLSFLGNRLLF